MFYGRQKPGTVGQLIENLRKRYKELARIRALKNMSTSGNFIKMKGSLPWPVDGKIILIDVALPMY